MTKEESLKKLKTAIEHSDVPMRDSLLETFYIYHPELRESEDERMVAAIKQAVRLSSREGGYLINNITREEALTWLEKQKECLADSSKTSASEDERIRKEIVGYLNNRVATAEETELLYFKRWIAYLEKQKEEEGYEAIPVESTLEYKLGFKAGKESEKQKELPFVKDVMLGYPGIYFYDGERMHFQGNPAMEEKQKEPHYTKRNALFDECVKNCDPEVMKRVSDEIDAQLAKEQKPVEASGTAEPDYGICDDYIPASLHLAMARHGWYTCHVGEEDGGVLQRKKYVERNWPADKDNLTQEQKEQKIDAKSELVIKAARRVLNNWLELDGTDCPDVSGDFAELEYAIREYDGEEKKKEQKRLPLMNGDADLYFDTWRQEVSVPTFRQCFEEGIKYIQRLQQEQKIDINKLRKDLYQSGYNDGYQHGKEDGQKERKPVDEKIVDEISKSVRKKWALDFINYLDANRPEGKMNVSNAECKDIEEAFFSADWEKIYKCYNKYLQKPVEYLNKDMIYAIMRKLLKLTAFSQRIPIYSEENKMIDEITCDVRKLLDYPVEQKPVNDKAFEEWIDDWWKHNKVNNPDSYDKGDEIQFDERGFKNFCRGIRNMYQQKPVHTAKEMWKEMRLEVYAQASGNRHEPNYSDDSTKMFSLCDIDEIFEKIDDSTVGLQPVEWYPTHEQMVALNWAAIGIDNNSPCAGDIKASLRSLYNDLQTKSIRPAECSDFPSKKQKESLHISETCKDNADSFTDEDEMIRKTLVQLVEDAWACRETAEVSDEKVYHACLAYLERQKNLMGCLKIANARIGELVEENYYLKEQNQWSEEDEKIAYTILKLLCSQVTYTTSGTLFPTYAKERDWFEKRFKSLRPQPKADLTLLDENIIKAAVAFVEQNDHFNCWCGIDKHTVITALRSLKPLWKPSEEQMKALKNSAYGVYQNGDGPILRDLYEQLKKLM